MYPSDIPYQLRPIKDSDTEALVNWMQVHTLVCVCWMVGEGSHFDACVATWPGADGAAGAAVNEA